MKVKTTAHARIKALHNNFKINLSLTSQKKQLSWRTINERTGLPKNKTAES